ncbi:MAG: cysteine desulfurase-like protein [Bacteroidales bacterium]|nr:cysteine desulfurase-like protein [Bacteroidales bacterium]
MPAQIKLNLSFVREQFPALKRDFIFMDNAGGSQVLNGVIHRISDYLINTNVQLGASYKVSRESGNRLDKSVKTMANYINAKQKEEVVVGPSSTMLLRVLSLTLSEQWTAGDEVIVSNSDHEANVSCWMDLRKKGIVVKIWKLNTKTMRLDLSDLKALLSPKTKLVTLVHASNILGTINPIKEIAGIVHKAGALICVDGVAFAPHRAIDVQALDVDFYVFSTYKLYGPHLAIMYGKYEHLRKLKSFNHYFIGEEEVPYKLQPGNFNFELAYSLAGIPEYLELIHDYHFDKEDNLKAEQKHQKSFELMAKHEEELAAKLIDYLASKKDIRIIGEQDADNEKRVPTISFVHSKLKSDFIVRKVDKFNIGIRFGDFYAKKIIEDFNLVEKNGVVRVSLVHYNTLEEVRKLIDAFETIL